MAVVSFKTGVYESYDNTNYVAGCIYFLYDTDGGRHIFLDGREYSGGDAVDIIFKNAITVTKDTGNYSAGDVIPANTSLQDLITNMLSEDVLPTAVSPAVTLSNTSSWVKAHEIGTTITLSYTASLSGGTYKVEGQADQAGGVTASAWSVVAKNNGTQVGDASTTASGNVGTYKFTNTSDKITVTATATGTQGNMPKTFLGNDYPSIRFAAGATYSKSTSNATCYRAKFYGWAADTTVDYSALTGAQIRAQDKGGKASSIPATVNTTNMQEMFFAAPTGTYTTVTVVNKNTGLPQTVKKYSSTVDVEGADGFTAVAYDVWYIKNDAAELGDSTFTITLS